MPTKATASSVTFTTILIVALGMISFVALLSFANAEGHNATTTVEMNRRAFDIFRGSDLEKDNLSLLYGKIDHLQLQVTEMHKACIR